MSLEILFIFSLKAILYQYNIFNSNDRGNSTGRYYNIALTEVTLQLIMLSLHPIWQVNRRPFRKL